MSILNANQVQLGNIIETSVGDFRVIGGQYGSVTKFYLLDIDALTFSKKADTIEELLEGVEVTGITGTNSIHYNITLNEDEPELGTMFVAIVTDEDGDTEMELRQIVSDVNGDAWFAIDPVTGLRKTRTKDTLEEVINAYDQVLAL